MQSGLLQFFIYKKKKQRKRQMLKTAPNFTWIEDKMTVRDCDLTAFFISWIHETKTTTLHNTGQTLYCNERVLFCSMTEWLYQYINHDTCLPIKILLWARVLLHSGHDAVNADSVVWILEPLFLHTVLNTITEVDD